MEEGREGVEGGVGAKRISFEKKLVLVKDNWTHTCLLFCWVILISIGEKGEGERERRRRRRRGGGGFREAASG